MAKKKPKKGNMQRILENFAARTERVERTFVCPYCEDPNGSLELNDLMVRCCNCGYSEEIR